MKQSIIDMHSKTIESIRAEADRKLTGVFKTVFLTVGKEWQAKYPKRKLELVAGMGTLFWVVDGEIVHTDNEAGYSKHSWDMLYKQNFNFSWKSWRVNSDDNHTRAYKIFEPLLNVLEWCNDNLENAEYLDRYLDSVQDFK